MGSNTFGEIFCVTTWGESHGKAIGCVIDGCPSQIELSECDVNRELEKRAPGKHRFTTKRQEPDRAEILSGVFDGKTTGTPISIIIYNKDADSSAYTSLKDLLRPGHANFTYLQKYGIFDFRGGGRASARETATRVASGAVAKKFLSDFKFEASLIEVGGEKEEGKIEAILEKALETGDSLGGVIEMKVTGLPTALGDPIFGKLEGKLAAAMLTLPACKGFEIGSGFNMAKMFGSQSLDLFEMKEGKISTTTNHSGGVLGGITNGMPLIFRVAFKPASSIKKPVETLNLKHEKAVLELPPNSRHDPCPALRACPIVEAMTALVLADAVLQQRTARK